VLSTEDPEIAAVGRELGVEVPFERPADLARDDTPSLPVVQHAIEWLHMQEAWEPDLLVLLQPTSPLRTARHIDDAVSRLRSAEADTVVSVVEVPHRFSPYALMELDDGHLREFWTGPTPFDCYRRQEMPVLYARNGPAVLVSRTSVLLDRGSFYGPITIPYVMNEEDSVDIDTWRDLRIAECLLSARRRAT
jgi:CMP-N-acetylneuraminic acid synthetase